MMDQDIFKKDNEYIFLLQCGVGTVPVRRILTGKPMSILEAVLGQILWGFVMKAGWMLFQNS